MSMIGEICKSPNLNNILRLKKEHNPKIYVEIGVLYGGSIILQMTDEQECFFIGIDPYTGYYGQDYDPHRSVDLTAQGGHMEIVKKNIDNNNPHEHKYELIKGNSNCSNVLVGLETALTALGGKVDTLFIDGDHSAKAVREDFYNYLPFMNVGGLILFDNYNDPSWTEVKPATDIIIEECDKIKLHSKDGHLCVVEVITS